MKIKTFELTGAALDWAVAKCDNRRIMFNIGGGLEVRGRTESGAELPGAWDLWMPWHPTTSWAQGGPIIDREKISIVWAHFHWCAGTGDIGEIYRSDEGNHFTGTGPTALVAAMHCYVASKLGEEVEVLDELA